MTVLFSYTGTDNTNMQYGYETHLSESGNQTMIYIGSNNFGSISTKKYYINMINVVKQGDLTFGT